MVIKSGILNLSNISAASNAKREIDRALILSFIGIAVLLFGVGITRLNIQNVYVGSWLTTSGFVTIIYSLIKLIISMVD
jgi:hypothetical protein